MTDSESKECREAFEKWLVKNHYGVMPFTLDKFYDTAAFKGFKGAWQSCSTGIDAEELVQRLAEELVQRLEDASWPHKNGSIINTEAAIAIVREMQKQTRPLCGDSEKDANKPSPEHEDFIPSTLREDINALHDSLCETSGEINLVRMQSLGDAHYSGCNERESRVTPEMVSPATSSPEREARLNENAFDVAWRNWVINTDVNKIDRDAALNRAIQAYLRALPPAGMAYSAFLPSALPPVGDAMVGDALYTQEVKKSIHRIGPFWVDIYDITYTPVDNAKVNDAVVERVAAGEDDYKK